MRRLKKALSLTLALALSLALAVPAFAAGTVKVVEDQNLGIKVTMNEFLREETHRYSFDDGMFILEQTIHVVADNSTVTVEALEGRKYADPVLQGSSRWSSINFDTNSPEYAAYQDFVNNRESYAYNSGESYVWDPEIKTFWNSNSSPSWPLTEVITYTVSPTQPEEFGICLDKLYGISPMCESDYAKLISVGTEQPTEPEKPTEPEQPTEPTTPTEPEQPTAPTTPSTPDTPGSYTVKKGDTWSTICTNFYGTNAQRYALQKANKGVALKEGAVITLPEKLGKDPLIPAPAAGAGEKLYTVKAGDTLGKIAAAEYGKVSEYKAIFTRNADRLKNANIIYEGQVIVLPVKK
jgi:LysM repeat protein